ncbi:4,5-DOPA-extradiol-dioxygenase [Hyphococcus lacteus]|uniref:4,5-DOPA dioxygenase extradiol n=1 Tax=Hyphococcus lacteus TaxID=3143536 RepID=A0ABV3Z4Q6_9PROT
MADSRMPVVFYGHGSPTIARETNSTTKTWREIAKSLPKPKAILTISAHWQTRGVAVTAMERPQTIHDFGRGLGADLFQIQYPAPGDPELAKRVKALLEPSVPVALDQRWGLDHGTWSVLMKAFPDADIPVVQLSMDATKEPEWHLELGRKLQPLRDEGILIIGTGNIVHNLGVMDWNEAAKPYDWATRFNDYVKGCVVRKDGDGLANYLNAGQDAARSVPSDDHYLPLLYAVGAAGDDYKVKFNPDFIIYKSLSMTTITFR